ncbi:FMN-binding negative transcriptional regulator [Shewanella sp. JM162201]|uniref:FMN-binding negative transcriptional regulator n=1 Tax=Shewanella jiangmenensis TaxID=2837387 RepID=A0ABS5V6G7_9GAMM|nr:FMN-binding negative transcriptional regulator [Shewanella jiangmenensis]
MYVPANMTLERRDALDLIRRESFALLVSNVGDSLQASHLPLILSDCETKLLGHMARANGQWQGLDGAEVLAIFSGPHAYISPRWYQGSPAVPTWNYTAVHVKGRLRLLDGDAALAVLVKAVKYFESDSGPDLLTDPDEKTFNNIELSSLMPPEYVAKLSAAIVAFEIEIESIEGKAKLGQQRKDADQRGVATALADTAGGAALLAQMKRLKLGLGGE